VEKMLQQGLEYGAARIADVLKRDVTVQLLQYWVIGGPALNSSFRASLQCLDFGVSQ